MGLVAALAVAPVARAASADTQAYESARRAYYGLKAGGGRAHGREPWVKVAASFEQVAKGYPRSDKAPLALYTAAELRNELSRVTLSPADRLAALQDYEKVSKLYPQSSLADDALYQIARIAFDREDDPERARSALDQLLARYPDSDVGKRARALLASLPAPVKQIAGKVAKAPAKPHPAAAKREASRRLPSHPPSDAKSDAEADTEEPPSADEAMDQAAKAEPSDAQGVDPVASAPAGMTHDEGDADDSGEELPAARPVVVEPRPAAVEGTHKLFEALRKGGAAPGGVPLAVQMGLRVHRVVIDAGHGGHDSGAVGPSGTREKDVTLAVAKQLAQELKGQGLEVLLSRSDDSFVALEDRAAFANKQKADLFISVHCNAARDRKLRGTEAYYLNVTDDRYAIRLAARENQASEKSLSDLQLILADMATKADVEESERLARSVEHSLTDGAPDPARRELGVKHALFYVLLGTKMPSVLVETAFISNRDDEKKLRSPKYQAALAHDIAAGVQQFLEERQGFAEVVP